MRFLVPALILVLPIPAGAGPWKVVGGHPVQDGSWPDAVALLSSGDLACSGVLVAPDLVLTAAHCDFGLTHAVVGARDYAVDGETIAIVSTTSYPRSWLEYDVAIAILEEPSTVVPRTMALDCIATDWLVDGADVAIAGYGAIDTWATEWTSLLYEARSFVTDHDCSDLGEGCQVDVSPGGELIAGGGGVDSCNGDSGGPLYLVTGEGDFLVGTTSRATDSALVPCGDGGIYVRADAIAAWIEEETGRVLPRPDCSDRNQPPAPTFEPVSVTLGQQAVVVVHANDPDPDDHHLWRLVSPPPIGRVTLEPDGRIVFDAGYSAVGPARFVVEVADDGVPSYAAQLTIEVLVEPAPIHRDECGCASPIGPSGPFALLLAALMPRRRPRKRQDASHTWPVSSSSSC